MNPEEQDRQDAQHIDDILDAADDMAHLVSAVSAESRSNRWIRRMGLHVLLEAGEASSRLINAKFDERHGERYPALGAMLRDLREDRHTVAHEYDIDDEEFLWRASIRELPALSEALETFRSDPANARMFDSARAWAAEPIPLLVDQA